ncbi:MAG: hypothetical protein JSU69_04275 [Candidatus Zixiibacteriota bacterium]|nr:MAG: hypothetical protein JSU69_04275 [candidate division Zixibacteria bacterium]
MKTIFFDDKGSALLISLCLLGMLTLLAIMAVNTSNTDIDLSFNQINADKALYIAEAGAKHAFIELNNDNSWRTGFSNFTFDDGSYFAVIIDSSSDSLLDDTVLIRATGHAIHANSEVEVWTVPEYIYPFRYAMFAEAGISLDKQTCTDSYNSDSGSYATTQLDEMGDVGSNGTVTSNKDVTFGGGISTATPGGITLGVNNTVTGDTTSAADSVDLDIIPAAEFAWAEANSDAPDSLSGFDYAYNNGHKILSTNANGSVTLGSGVYYFSSITLGQFSQLNLAAGASVVIYVTGDIVLGQGSTINVAGKPSQLLIFSSGSRLQFDQGNTFVGSFYGPNAHIQYDQTTQVFGSLVGNTIQLDAGACLHYDRNLAKIKHGTTGKMILVAWREI